MKKENILLFILAALQFTIFTATVPDRLTKVLTLAPDGTLHKESAANMMRAKPESMNHSIVAVVLQTTAYRWMAAIARLGEQRA